MRFRLILLLPLLILFGCRANTSTANLTISMQFASENPAVGEESTINVTVLDSAGNPVNDATVSVRGDMTHAGMNPVVAEASSGANGVYAIPFAFSMAGDWVITVDVTLADGSKASQTFNVNGIGSANNEDATEDAMAGMSMGGSDATEEASMAMAVSAAYFSITNTGTSDIRLVSVSAEDVGSATIHQTIVENNIARMEEVEGGLLIPAGETVELAPGGSHVMLMDLANPLVAGETLVLVLTFDNGTSISVEAPIAIDTPDETGSAEAEGIQVEGAWLRPTM